MQASVRSGWLGIVAAVAAVLGVVGTPAGARAEQSAPFRVSDAEKSVVRVVVLLFDANNQFLAASVGSGFVVAPERVMTNHHVIEGEGVSNVARREVFIVPDPHSGRQRVTGQVIRDSTDPDLALIRAPGLTAPVMRIAGVFPDKDAVIHALGFPGVTDRILNRTPQEMMAPSEPSVTAGSIALFSDRGPGGSHVPTIFHTAFINPGNSGGPLIDPCGRIIGINTWSGTATMSAEGVSVPQGQFIAIQSTALARFLTAAGISNRPEQDACIPPIDPRIQSMVQQQQAELSKLREDRAREVVESRRNMMLMVGAVIVVLLGGGAAFLALRRRAPAAAPIDPTRGYAPPPVPLAAATLASDPAPGMAATDPPSLSPDPAASIQPPAAAPPAPPATSSLPPLGPPPPLPPSGGPPVVLLILAGLAVLVLAGGFGAWRLGLFGRLPPPQAEADRGPATPPQRAPLQGNYALACTARSAGAQDVTVVFDADRGCADGTLAYERTPDGFVRLQLDPVTGTITRLTLSPDLTTYSRSLFSPTRAQFDHLNQAGSVPAACAPPGDLAALAQLSAQLRGMRTAALPLLTRPGATATWRCVPAAAPPAPAPEVIPGPTPIPTPPETNSAPEDTPPAVDTPPETRPEPPREPEAPQAEKPVGPDDQGVEDEPPLEDPEDLGEPQ